MLFKLGYFVNDYVSAISICGVQFEEVLVVSFGRIEIGQRANFRRNYPENFFFKELGFHLLCRFALCVVIIENHRAILWSDIRSLLVFRGRIVRLEEDQQHLVERNHRWVKGNLTNFRMP